MPELQRLLYSSTATGSTDSLLNVATILGRSQKNNSERRLTGALAAHRGQFIQVIEGPADEVGSLIDRLMDDPRHKDLRIIQRVSISERDFEGWSMASARVTPDLAPLLDRVLDRLESCPDETIAALRSAAS